MSRDRGRGRNRGAGRSGADPTQLRLPWPQPVADGEDPGDGPVRVVVLGAPGCHLCQAATAQVQQACAQVGAGWRYVELADAPPEHAVQVGQKYRELIPVVFVDDAEHAYWRIEPAALERALRRRPRRRISDFVHFFTKS